MLKMKRLCLLLFSAALCLSLCACGSKSTEKTGSDVINEYIDKGYFVNSSQIIDQDYIVMVVSEDGSDNLKITISMSDKEYNDYMNLDMMAEDYFEKADEIINNLSGTATVESLNDKIPSQEDIDKYVGKTIAEVEAENNTYSSSWDLYSDDFKVYESFDTGDGYGIVLRFYVEIPDGKTQQDLTDEDVPSLKIVSSEFVNLELY